MTPRNRWTVAAVLLACGAVGCDDTAPADDTGDNPPGDCTDAPADALTADSITPGGTSVVCFYGPPEGYCRDMQSSASAANVEGGDKAAIGCADALVVTDGACPTDGAVGRCLWSAEETRVYYQCNQYDVLFPGGPQESCESVGGTWEQ